jgi:hypothetical protein
MFVTNAPDLTIDPDDDDDDLELYGALVRPLVKPRFIDVARLANAWCQHYPETAQRGNGGIVEPQNVAQDEDDGHQRLAYPSPPPQYERFDPFSTLYPGTTTWYQYTSEMNPLKVAMKISQGNPRTKQAHRYILMKPHPKPKHEGIHLLGVTCLEDSTSGIGGQGVLMMRNNPEMKRTFRNEVAMRTMIQNEATVRTMIQTIWLLGLVDIKEALRNIVL